MSSVKPSRRIFFLIVACVVGVGTIGFAVYAAKARDNSSSKSISVTDTNSQTAQIIAGALKTTAEIDTDNDNLLDWEEILWSTDPKNPDSDKDGTKDGDEVKANRNPMVAGPEDKLTDLDDSTKTKAVIQVESDKTQTGQISRELFSNYLEAKRAGVALDSQVQNKIISETFYNKNFEPAYKRYSTSDVKVTTSSDLKTYGNNLGLAFYEGRTENPVSEMEILSDAMLGGNQEAIQQIDPIIQAYTATLRGLEQVQVPSALVSKHLALLNSTSKLLADITGFRQIFSDPLAGIAAVGNYYGDVDVFQRSLIDIKNELDKSGITFTQDEFGSVFTKTIQ